MQNKPKKILYLITKSNYGGAQKYLFELSSAAKDKGYEVSVACGGTGKAGASPGKLTEKLNSAKIPVLPIKHFMRDMSLIDDVRAFFEVWKIIRKQRPDILHVSSSKAGGIGALAGKLSGVQKVIFTSHGLTIDEVWRPRWQKILVYLGTWITLRLADQSIMISTETFERAKKMPGLSDRVSLIKNGIAPIDFLGCTEARAKLAPQVPTQALWIGGIGELHPNKNWSAAILALKSLPSHAHLLIIGEGEERIKLEKLITRHHLQDRIHLLGFHMGAPLLKAFDIFILPSKKEGLPYVLLEAGLAKLSTIASDLPGNRDIIKNGKSGLLIKPTPKLIAETLEKLIKDEVLRKRLAINLNKTVKTDFSIQEMFNKTLLIYEPH